MNIGGYEIVKGDVKVAVEVVFICTAIILSYVLGRLSMSYEINTILEYSCKNQFMNVSAETNTITIAWPEFQPKTTLIPIYQTTTTLV